MKKNLAKRISAGILATFLGMGIGYCDSVWADDSIVTIDEKNSLQKGDYIGKGELLEDKYYLVDSNNNTVGIIHDWGDGIHQKSIYLIGNFKNNSLTLDNFTFNNSWDGEMFTGIYTSANFDIDVEVEKISQNHLKIKNTRMNLDNLDLDIATAYCDYNSSVDEISDNHLIVEDSKFENGTMLNISAGKNDNNNSLKEVNSNTVEIINSIFEAGTNEIYGGYCNGGGNVYKNTVKISKSTFGTDNNSETIICGGQAYIANNNVVEIDADNKFHGSVEIVSGRATQGQATNNVVYIKGDVNGDIYGAYNTVNSDDDYSASNKVEISAGAIKGNIYGAYNETSGSSNTNGNLQGNCVEISGTADLKDANLYGYKHDNNRVNEKNVIEDNNLIINNWTGNVKSINNFNNIEFKTINWEKDGTVLNITGGNFTDLANTGIKVDNETNLVFAGGYEFTPGESMTLVNNDNGINGVNGLNDTFTASAGVAGEVSGIITGSQDSVDMTIEKIGLNNQVELVAENRAVAAAFVNQGTDLINDSLDVLSRDGKYGIKTFAAVHGNRSKYDVNSDLKINGWSSIVGVGNEKNIGNGDLSWGVFYENGSGNYRTYNEFNNEFFRGDGSLVYNGGGIAARFEQDNGVYTEGSLRAGMLKSEMTNALKDGAGNSYGYKSESSYYGAHIGVGKIISLNEATDLDVYGKFFHTYTDGDSFTVANDKFEFDSITSDRLRIGARLTTNKENKFSTYYGLAYEYEFNGDADMRAQNMSAPEQSLKGSSYMAEIGMNYKPSSESPWSFDLSMRGYAGQRDGFSGNIQATYTF